MKRIITTLLSIALCVLNIQGIIAQEEDAPPYKDGTGGLTDYTDLFLSENPDAQEEEECEIAVFNELGPERNEYTYLAVMIEFPDMEQFSLDSDETIEKAELFFNDTTNNYEITDSGQILPLLSFKSYIQKYSYGNTDVTTYIMPRENGKVVSYVAPHPQGYYKAKTASNPDGYDNTIFEDGNGNIVYQGGIKQQWAREFELLNGAVDALNEEISSLGLTGSDLDINGDNKIDSISFFCEAGDYLHYGGSYTYNSLLWSHKLSGCTKYMHKILGKNISFYNLILGYDSNNNEKNGTFSTDSPTFGTVIHEFMHILGIPDMYRTSYQGTYPVGYYDVMATNNKVIPQPTLTYNVTGECYNVNWHDPLEKITKTTQNVEITEPKYKNSSERNAIKIMVPGSSTQFFVAEYYDQPESLSIGRGDSSGIIVYRINTSNAEKGNTLGTMGGTKDFSYIMRPGDSRANIGNGNYLSEAVLNSTRNHYGKLIDGIHDSYDSETLYLADGTNSGIVIDVVSQTNSSVTLNITYSNPIKAVTMDSTLSLVEGQTHKLVPTIAPADTNMSKKITWTSSNSSVASVDEEGNVTAHWKGKTIITAKTINGVEAECEVHVSLRQPVSVYRLYKESDNVHQYVTDREEVEALVEEGWEDEGVAWLAPVQSSVPVYRFKNEKNQYYYTMHPSDVDTSLWENEGIAFYSDESENTPIYVVKGKTGVYYYTNNFKEYNELGKKGWDRLGIAWYGREN